MLSKDHSSKAPAGAEGEVIILQAPACVQRFTAPRQILGRLRALARRRGRPAVPETAETPVKLQVEANPNWSATDGTLLEGLGTGLREWLVEADDAVANAMGAEETGEDLPTVSGSMSDGTGPAGSRREAAEAERSAAVIHQLEEDNQDLKAALCRLIRVSEENHAAIRLLEEENEDLSATVRRLTLEKEAISRGTAPVARRPAGMPGWGIERLRRWGHRCS